jgi:preprotein translocase SecE subunit
VSIDPQGEAAEPSGGLPVEQRRESALARLAGFARGSWLELQRVHWPDRRQVMQATGVVLGFVIIAGVFLGLADLVSSKLVHFVLYTL